MDLYAAAEVGDLQWIFDNPPSLDEILADDNSVLRWASQHGQLDIVKYLHQHGADITVIANAPARMAAGNGHLDVVRYLCRNGADITVNENEIIQVASQHGHLDVVEYLHQNGGDILLDDNIALRIASLNGRLDIVKYCIDNGADPFVIDATNTQLRSIVAESFLEQIDLSALNDKPITKKFMNAFGKHLQNKDSTLRRCIQLDLFGTLSLSQIENVLQCPMIRGRTLEKDNVNNTSTRRI